MILSRKSTAMSNQRAIPSSDYHNANAAELSASVHRIGPMGLPEPSLVENDCEEVYPMKRQAAASRYSSKNPRFEDQKYVETARMT